MSSKFKFAVPFFVVGLAVFGCSSSDNPTPGTGGTNGGAGKGGTTGSAGQGGFSCTPCWLHSECWLRSESVGFCCGIASVPGVAPRHLWQVLRPRPSCRVPRRAWHRRPR